mmetsp:Transcript_27457/g.78890  ORF Transcript_27457/g.78890 Transcript_27457/m.78890 type:complete len:229 (+) Transcript_27457:170-856(+)
MSLSSFTSKVSSSSAALNAAHLSATKRMWPLTILTVAFWIRMDAPFLQTAVCASPRSDTMTMPVSSPQTASMRLSEAGTFSGSLTHFTLRLTPLESGSMSLTFPNFGLARGFFSGGAAASSSLAASSSAASSLGASSLAGSLNSLRALSKSSSSSCFFSCFPFLPFLPFADVSVAFTSTPNSFSRASRSSSSLAGFAPFLPPFLALASASAFSFSAFTLSLCICRASS